MLRAHTCVKNITCIKRCRFFDAIVSEMHINDAIHDCKNFLSIVDMPFVGLIRPMEFDCRAIQIGDR